MDFKAAPLCSFASTSPHPRSFLRTALLHTSSPRAEALRGIPSPHHKDLQTHRPASRSGTHGRSAGDTSSRCPGCSAAFPATRQRPRPGVGAAAGASRSSAAHRTAPPAAMAPRGAGELRAALLSQPPSCFKGRLPTSISCPFHAVRLIHACCHLTYPAGVSSALQRCTHSVSSQNHTRSRNGKDRKGPQGS